MKPTARSNDGLDGVTDDVIGTNDVSNHGGNQGKKEKEVEGEEEGFSVLDLTPETHYKLRMTAHNSAGSTVSVYGFATLTFGGATVAPELIIHSEYKLPGFLKLLVNPSIVLPVVLALIVIASMMVFVVHQLKKDRFLLRGRRFWGCSNFITQNIFYFYFYVFEIETSSSNERKQC